MASVQCNQITQSNQFPGTLSKYLLQTSIILMDMVEASKIKIVTGSVNTDLSPRMMSLQKNPM
ncbi:hypothetical protein WICANDRAFT_87111, partial [Wickerhamomyces anomalus NRRL Y-366-8]